MKIYFVTNQPASTWRDIASLDERDISRSPKRFQGGRNSWIAQTYVRLKKPLAALGIESAYSSCFVPGQICIAHRDDINEFFGGAHRSFVVGVRADRPLLAACQFELHQNDLIQDTESSRYVPLWPQPGLLQRNQVRGHQIRRIGYMGRAATLPAWLKSQVFRDVLARRGIDLHINAQGWHDYRDLDLLLAVRNEAATMLEQKPATKLYNAWLAGVPVLIAPEPAYNALRRNPLDFIAVASPEDVLNALDRFSAEPLLYEAMVKNGLERAREFDVNAITQRWMRLIVDAIVPAYRNWETSEHLAALRWLTFARSMLAQKVAAKRFRWLVGQELKTLATREIEGVTIS